MRIATTLASLLFATALLAGCASDDGSSNGGPTTTAAGGATTTHGAGEGMVHVVDNEFEDGDRTIAAGSSIQYMNEGARAHTVTIHWVGEPASVTRLNQTLQPGQDVTFEFTDKGTYHVWCRFHGTMTSGMASTVTVT